MPTLIKLETMVTMATVEITVKLLIQPKLLLNIIARLFEMWLILEVN